MSDSNTSVQPYLFFNGRCEEALEFYRGDLGAEVEMLSLQGRARTSMKQLGMENKVMHASFRIGDTLMMASDGRCDGQPRFEGFSLSIIAPGKAKSRDSLQRVRCRREGYSASWADILGTQIRNARRSVRRWLDGIGSAQTLAITGSSKSG